MNDLEKDDLLFEEFPPISSEAWHELIIKDLKGADFDKKLIWKPCEGMAIMPYYRQEDLKSLKFLDTLPGESPYVRGNLASSNHWIIRQDFEITDIVKANALALRAIEGGVQAVGLDASDIKTLSQLETLLAGINPETTQIHFIQAHSFPALLDLFLTYLGKNKFDKLKVTGSFNYDPIACLLQKGKFHKSWELHTKDISLLINKVKQEIPGFKALNMSAYLFHNAGSSLIQELAFGLAAANEYLAGLTEKGLTVDDIAQSMMFTFAVGSDYFPEIAKLRAARYLWSHIVEQYRPAEKKSMQMYIHSVNSTWNKTLYDTYVNILRTTTETMSAGIAGSAIINVTPFDKVYKEADDFSLRVARNQQIVLQQESYLGKIVDPGAGSYYIEKLTDEIARLSWDIFKSTEAKGGFISCFHQNIIQSEIEKVSKQKISDIANRKLTLLGTNQYPNLNEEMLEKVVSHHNDNEPVGTEVRPLLISRGAEALENIRLATERHVRITKRKPEVFLFSMGNLAMRKARATFSNNFFGCAGYKIIDNAGFTSVEEGMAACMKVNPAITVICSADEEYAELVPAICDGLKKEGYQGILVLAGYPKDIIDQLKEAGIREFIHARTNLLESLTHFHQLLGITI